MDKAFPTMMLDTRPDADPALAPFYPFLVEQMPVGIIIAAVPSGRILQANGIARALIPLDPERRVGYHPDGRGVAADEWPLARARSGEVIAGEEYQVEQPDGSRRWVKIAASPLRPGGEGVQATLCVITDIDPRKRQEAALRAAEADYHSFFDHAPDGFYRATLDGHLVRANTALARMHGYATSEDYIEAARRRSSPTDVFVDQDDADRLRAEFAANGVVSNFVCRLYRTGTGEVFWASLSLRIVHDEASGGSFIDGSARDITAYKHQEDALRRAEAEREANRQARELLEALPLAVYTTDAEGRITYFNQAAADIAGRRPEIGSDRWCVAWWLRNVDGTPLPLDECPMAAVLREKRPVRNAEAVMERPDGTCVPMALYPTPLFDAAGELAGAVNVLVDLTERKASEQALRRSEAQLARAQRIGGIGSWALDLGTGEVQMSDEASRIFGVDPARFAPTLANAIDLYHPEDRALIRHLVERARDGEMASRDCRVVRPDGEVRWVHLQYEPEGSDLPVARLVGVIQDITRRKRAEEALRRSEERLRESQKLEAVGKLTGGIAHEFNNLLAVVIANLDIMEADPTSPEGGELIDLARQACFRGAELTSQLLAFGRRQPLQPRRHRLDALVADQMKILAPSLGKDVAVRMDLPADLWPVEIDGHQFQLALTHLANNARDAMPDGGALTVAARNVRIEAGDAEIGIAAGDYVAVEVADTGSGMAPDVLARAVEPFFTTKELGRGTGLGLSMVFGFAKQSGGHLDLDSAPGRGTRVLLHLPRAAVRPDAARSVETPGLPRARAREVVLVVDDNEPLRRTIARQLGALGYDVLEACGRLDAMGVLATAPRIDLLLTDMALPDGGHGAALVDEAARDGLRVLLMSGTTEESPILREALSRGLPFLRKPFRLADLAARLRRLLDA